MLYYGTTGIPLQDDLPEETRIYPNPVNSTIHISSNPVHTGKTYLVYDRFGKTITSGEITGELITVHFSDLEEGLYLISIGGNSTSTFMFIKE